MTGHYYYNETRCSFTLNAGVRLPKNLHQGSSNFLGSLEEVTTADIPNHPTPLQLLDLPANQTEKFQPARFGAP